MNVFVTGATGFIGKHLVRRLVAEGHEVCCLIRSNKNLRPFQGLGLKFVAGDVNNRAALQAGMDGCDWLFHLANLYSMWEPENHKFHRINVDGTRDVLESALAARVKKVIYVSTVAVYGKPDKIPFTEQDCPGPVLFSEYARTKAAADQIAWELYQSKDLPLTVLYPGIVLGAGDDKASGHYIQDILRRRVPSTIFHQSCCTYVYVGDVVEAMLRAAEKPDAIGEKYFLGKYTCNGRDYANLIQRISGVPLPIFRFPDWMVLAAAYLLTGLSALTHRPPWWGLSVDAGCTLKNGFVMDGSKAERELGIIYTPIHRALEEAIASYQTSVSPV